MKASDDDDALSFELSELKSKLRKVTYTRHLSERLKLRDFSIELPKTVFEAADRRYRDIETGHFIAVKDVGFRGRMRLLMIAYDPTEQGVEIVTIHPISMEQEKSRTRGGRWTRVG